MEDDYTMTIGRLKAALACTNPVSSEKALLQTWLSGLMEADGTTPAGDDDTIIIKHPK